MLTRFLEFEEEGEAVEGDDLNNSLIREILQTRMPDCRACQPLVYDSYGEPASLHWRRDRRAPMF